MSQNKITVKLVGSLIGQTQKTRKVVYGLGLRKINSSCDLIDNNSIRGMIKKVSHLVSIIE